MSKVVIGSARSDERGKLKGGSVGDQKQTATPDYKGEVSLQDFYVHTKGWYIIRPKQASHAVKLANAMRIACDNKNLGYDQNNRLGVITYGIDTKVKTECDCATLVRACVKYAMGVDVGNFTTLTACNVLRASKLFDTERPYTTYTTLYVGDILVTKTKGHIVIVVEGEKRNNDTVYTQANFIQDVETILKCVTTQQCLDKSVTISTTVNKNHALVTPLERYMKYLGYYKGDIEADFGKVPSFGNGMKNAIKLYQKNVVKATVQNQDGIITAKKNTWKKLLGII